jgi:hypothetical protein
MLDESLHDEVYNFAIGSGESIWAGAISPSDCETITYLHASVEEYDIDGNLIRDNVRYDKDNSTVVDGYFFFIETC